ncbi:hypothetical protein GN330_17855 [Nitratireductor sp. CAU 1489]|uniref:Uncharacterized protein n=1 Tax=Nitratireductor arenosus TaxID=2682096 RepID=A0A844QIU1_9HYPH|nr:hypothetical protein [Nitratireductor arenosus]MVA99117.1 hypothetical protein [Nitratireductor arenosus]
MSHYLVTAKPRGALMAELSDQLDRAAFRSLKPFGGALTVALENACLRADGNAMWEEEDYCDPPLAEERVAVLDRYFDDLRVEAVEKSEGWRRIAGLPALFPDLAANKGN